MNIVFVCREDVRKSFRDDNLMFTKGKSYRMAYVKPTSTHPIRMNDNNGEQVQISLEALEKYFIV